MADAAPHEAQHLALFGVQRVEERRERTDQAGASSTQRVEPGVQQLLGRGLRKPLAGDQAGQLGTAGQALQRLTLLLELVQPGAEETLLLVVQVQLGGCSGDEVAGHAVSVTAESVAMAAVAPVVRMEIVMCVPATKKVHDVLSGRSRPCGWDGTHDSRAGGAVHLDAVSPGFVLYRPAGAALHTAPNTTRSRPAA